MANRTYYFSVSQILRPREGPVSPARKGFYGPLWAPHYVTLVTGVLELRLEVPATGFDEPGDLVRGESRASLVAPESSQCHRQRRLHLRLGEEQPGSSDVWCDDYLGNRDGEMSVFTSWRCLLHIFSQMSQMRYRHVQRTS